MASLNPQLDILLTNRLTGPNFSDWLSNLRIVLTLEKIGYVLKSPVPEKLPDDASEEKRAAYQKWKDDDEKAVCCMLASMNCELQRQHESMESSYEILIHLQGLYGGQSRMEKFNIFKEIFTVRMEEGSSVLEHGLKMINYIAQLEKLGSVLDKDLATDLILQSLPDSFSQFVMNFYMNKLDCELTELVNMLTTAEKYIKKENGSLLAISEPSTTPEGWEKNKDQLKAKGKINKGQFEKAKTKGRCFYCSKEGHWKRNCKDYLATLKHKPSEGMS